LTVCSIGGFYSATLATHGGDHCTLEQHLDLIGKGYNNIQEADICAGKGLDPRKDYRNTTDRALDQLLPESRATFCQTQYGQCALNGGPPGGRCICMGPDGRQYSGFAVR
jgi:hypothetical protein